jgi:hypothetical protein
MIPARNNGSHGHNSPITKKTAMGKYNMVRAYYNNSIKLSR